MQRVLIVEDCADEWRLIERALGPELEVRRCDSLSSARTELESWRPDLVLLDVGLPDGDGFAFCADLQSREHTRDLPVMFVSARCALSDKLMAFGLGAEDFVEKPFNAAELRARIAARLRKQSQRRQRNALRIFGPLRIDSGCFRAQIRENGADRDLDLTSHELRLLLALANANGRVMSRSQLMVALVGDCVITERTVDSHLCNLRRKLGPMRELIQTVRGVGYRLVLPPRDQGSVVTSSLDRPLEPPRP